MPRKKRKRRLPNGLGSIVFLKGRRSGYWARKPAIILPDGKAYRKSLGYFESYEEAYKALMKESESENDKITIFEVYEDFISSNKFKKNSMSTIERYERDFNRLGDLRYKPIQSVTYSMLQAKIDEIQDQGYVKKGKRHSFSMDKMKKIKTILNKIYTRALKDEIVNSNIAELIEVEGVKKPKKFNNFSIEEIKKLFELSKTHKDLRYPLVHIFFGFRTIEMVNFRKKHINFEKNIVKGMGAKTDKGRSGFIGIIPIIKPILKELYDETDDYILGRKMSTDTYRRQVFYKALDKVNMRKGRTPYNCRDTFANLLNHFNVDIDIIKDMMRHEDASTTLNNYITQDREKAILELHKITF